jgi:hypothetical protein
MAFFNNLSQNASRILGTSGCLGIRPISIEKGGKADGEVKGCPLLTPIYSRRSDLSHARSERIVRRPGRSSSGHL